MENGYNSVTAITGKEKGMCKLVQTRKLSVGYGRKMVIENIEISLPKGEILTLIGPNGAGKSTLLKTFTGQLPLLEGDIYLEQKDQRQMSEMELARRLSMVMTDPIRPELMTCYDVVSTGRYPYTGKMGMLSARDREKVEEALKLVLAEELADQLFSDISDGQRQRIMLARAICQEPELMILDEPTSFLDIRHKLEFLSILKKMVREKQLTVIMSLHELELVQKISDQVMCVKEGRIDRYGTPEEIFTASYIRELYGITKGQYVAELGVTELEPVKENPRVFVIGGGGMGLPVYHRLQRQGRSFIAGILQENDLEYPVARALAAQVVSEKAFEPVGEDTLQTALSCLEACEEVICCPEHFGTLNAANEKLLERAVELGKTITKALQ